MATIRTDTPAARTSRSRSAKGKGADLQGDLREFAKGRPQGWNHDDWLGFLEHLKSRGHNIHDHEAIGAMLERERINVLLSKVPGLGPQRVNALAEKFESVWRLREASAEEIASAARLPRELSKQVVEALH